ncbi:degenerin unc-8-like [Mercenaria mercenaria]|uniref:degenerin unc-8-like n=1 Tax=Mercenaria mercenaria TaxID=6596 RepID=UPI00234E7B69|nr:degenerin unc-8-like [Mercenaria mercenaria]
MAERKNPPFFSRLQWDIYGYNYTSYDAKYENVTISNDIMWKTLEQFRMQMATLDRSSLDHISQPYKEFFLLCNFAGEECDSETIIQIRSYNYGMCYKFKPQNVKALEPHGKVAGTGPKYALELLLNVDQRESIPLVTSSAGVVVGTDAESWYFHENHGVFIPTGFETNIALSSVSKQRVPGWGKKLRCKDSSNGLTLLDCQKECKLEDISEKCGCYLYFFQVGHINGSVSSNNTVDQETGYVPCYTAEHYECIQNVHAEYMREPAEKCADCIPPCSVNWGVACVRCMALVVFRALNASTTVCIWEWPGVRCMALVVFGALNASTTV